MPPMKTIVILISGRGSNMRALIETARQQNWPERIAAVISNRGDAPGLEFARAHGIATEVVESRQFATRDAFDAALQSAVDAHAPDLVVLAGFMRILTADFVAHYASRMLNIHPSLLPSFSGIATHRQALAAGVKVHGATVHFVTPQLDHGPIVAQAAVRVHEDDTEETLAQRVLEQEHRIYPLAVRWFLDGRLTLENNRVCISDDIPNTPT
jgi:phosphoribosylglycinamide formyltransferase-1